MPAEPHRDDAAGPTRPDIFVDKAQNDVALRFGNDRALPRRFLDHNSTATLKGTVRDARLRLKRADRSGCARGSKRISHRSVKDQMSRRNRGVANAYNSLVFDELFRRMTRLFQDLEFKRQTGNGWLRFSGPRSNPQLCGIPVAGRQFHVQFASLFASGSLGRFLLFAGSTVQIFAFRLHGAVLRLNCYGHTHQC
jgi:hypothetical protein